MPRFISAALVALAFVPTLAFGQGAQGKAGHEMEADHAKSAWKEMDAFHALLGATFHPASSKKDVAPLRAKANELAAAARAWSASQPPATCATTEVKSRVATISTDALSLANLVLAGAASDSLLTGIDDLHTKFEKVEKACSGHAMKHDGV